MEATATQEVEGIAAPQAEEEATAVGETTTDAVVAVAAAAVAAAVGEASQEGIVPHAEQLVEHQDLQPPGQQELQQQPHQEPHQEPTHQAPTHQAPTHQEPPPPPPQPDPMQQLPQPMQPQQEVQPPPPPPPPPGPEVGVKQEQHPPPQVENKQEQPASVSATSKIQWQCQLLFNEADKGEEERLRDICPYLTAVPFIKGYPPKTSYRFPPRFKGMDKVNDLVKEICRGGARSGYTLIKRSSETKSSKIRTMTVRLACNRHVVKERKKAVKPPPEGAGDAMSPEQLLAAQQPPPKKRQRKAATVRPATLEDRCPFNFTIFLAANDDFWYLSHRDALSGDDPVTNFCTHVGHPRNDPVVGATVTTSTTLPIVAYGNMAPLATNGQPIEQVVLSDNSQLQKAMKVVKTTVDMIGDDKEEFDNYMKHLEELHNGIVTKKEAGKQVMEGVV